MIGLALALLIAVPGHDLRSAAERLAPPGARVTLAYEQDADYGVAAYVRNGTTTALAFRWRDRRWTKAQRGPLRIEALSPRAGASVRQPVLAKIRFHLEGRYASATVWIDGKRTPADTYAANDEYFVLRGQRRGVHRVIAFVGGGGYATARTWTYTVL